MNLRALLEEILDTALKVSTERARIRSAFEKSGVSVTDDMMVQDVTGNPEEVIKSLMQNLTEMAVVKISAKQVIRKAGIYY